MKAKLLIISLATLFFMGCKSNAKFVITPEDATGIVTVYSDSIVDEFFRVLPGTYDLVSNDDGLSVEITFEVLQSVSMPVHEQYDSFTLVPRDKDDYELGEKIIFNAKNGREQITEFFDAPEGTQLNVIFQYAPIDKNERDFIIENMGSCAIKLQFIDLSTKE